VFTGGDVMFKIKPLSPLFKEALFLDAGRHFAASAAVRFFYFKSSGFNKTKYSNILMFLPRAGLLFCALKVFKKYCFQKIERK